MGKPAGWRAFLFRAAAGDAVGEVADLAVATRNTLYEFGGDAVIEVMDLGYRIEPTPLHIYSASFSSPL